MKGVVAGDLIQVKLASPGGTFDNASYFLIGQTFATGFPPPGFGNIWINQAAPLFILVDPAPTPIGSPVIPAGGASTFYQVPAGLSGSGLSFMLQGFPLSPAAANGVFAISDAHEIQFL